MLKGKCLCGACSWTYDDLPDRITACNCGMCIRSGVLWAYGWIGGNVTLTGPVKSYVRTDLVDGEPCLELLFCPTCGNTLSWRGLEPDADGRTRIAVNIRLISDSAPIANIPIRHFDGAGKFEEVPGDGRCVKDMWY